jgi:hypothetical protein
MSTDRGIYKSRPSQLLQMKACNQGAIAATEWRSSSSGGAPSETAGLSVVAATTPICYAITLCTSTSTAVLDIRHGAFIRFKGRLWKVIVRRGPSDFCSDDKQRRLPAVGQSSRDSTIAQKHPGQKTQPLVCPSVPAELITEANVQHLDIAVIPANPAAELPRPPEHRKQSNGQAAAAQRTVTSSGKLPGPSAAQQQGPSSENSCRQAFAKA